jgi:polysaccharide export outer membrane protein
MEMEKTIKLTVLSLALFVFANLAVAAEEAPTQDDLTIIKSLSGLSAPVKSSQDSSLATAKAVDKSFENPIKYTLGPEDAVEIVVLRHPEFSGTYPINQEGIIQYKFVGDIEVTGLTKKELEEKITGIISAYVLNPEVNVTITQYRSKVIYVVGEVGAPGKYYMQSDTLPVREAVVNAGLPTLAAAMRRCRLITPNNAGNAVTKNVDLYTILYNGDLQNNLDMKPGDVLYVPATVMSKIVRIINPVTAPIASINGGGDSATSLATKAAMR